MIPHQLILKLQGFQTVFTETICVFTLNINTFLITEFRTTALTGRNIAHFALKCFSATRTMFYLMFMCHGRKIKNAKVKSDNS